MVVPEKLTGASSSTDTSSPSTSRTRPVRVAVPTSVSNPHGSLIVRRTDAPAMTPALPITDTLSVVPVRYDTCGNRSRRDSLCPASWESERLLDGPRRTKCPARDLELGHEIREVRKGKL